MSKSPPDPRFSAPHVIEYSYRRSLGAVLGRFFTELRGRQLVGIRRPGGQVLVPPCEYDPDTGESLDEIVPVGPGGVVTTWAWVTRPTKRHPLDHPFAWALIRLDGADTGMLHAVDAGSESAMSTGMRVKPRWRSETVGEILDLACFEIEGAA